MTLIISREFVKVNVKSQCHYGSNSQGIFLTLQDVKIIIFFIFCPINWLGFFSKEFSAKIGRWSGCRSDDGRLFIPLRISFFQRWISKIDEQGNELQEYTI